MAFLEGARGNHSLAPKNGSLVIFPHTYSLVFFLHQTFLPGITWLVKGETDMEVWIGMLIPFAGTALGAACVIFMGAGVLNARTQGALAAFAAGVMAAASVWSLLLPAISQSAALGPWAFAPATAGLGLGAAFIWALDRWLPEPQNRTENAMMILAVTLHNVPEGMAVGAAWAGVRSGITGVTAAAMALALGIAIQNVPEGAIVALPLRAAGKSRARAFAGGTASGAVEPLAAGGHSPALRADRARSSRFAGIRRRGHDLCHRGRADPQGGPNSPRRPRLFRAGLQPDDGPGCGAGMTCAAFFINKSDCLGFGRTV